MSAAPESRLDLLPDDLAFQILEVLGPREIIRMRQVCTRFELLSRDSALWRRLYSSPQYFLSPGPAPLTPVTLEKRLVQASRMENWPFTSNPLPPFRQEIPFGSWVQPFLLSGQYLLIGGGEELAVYNLDALSSIDKKTFTDPSPLHRLKCSEMVGNGRIVKVEVDNVPHENTSRCYLAIVVARRYATMLFVYELAPGVSLERVFEATVSSAYYSACMSFHRGFLAYTDGRSPEDQYHLSNRVLHAPTGRIYNLNDANPIERTVFTEKYMIAISPTRTSVKLQLFALPTTNQAQFPYELDKVNEGECPFEFTEPLYLCSIVEDGLDVIFLTVMHAHRIRIIRLSLLPDRTLTFETMAECAVRTPFDIQGTVRGARYKGGRLVPGVVARLLSLSGEGSNCTIAYSISCDDDGKWDIITRWRSEMVPLGTIAFDGFSGRVCLLGSGAIAPNHAFSWFYDDIVP